MDAASAPLPQYGVHDGDPARDRATVLALWEGNLGRPGHMADKFEWFYLRCPYGRPLLQLLKHNPDQAWVGVCSAGRRRMLWRGREIRAGVLVDLAVLPQHRSLGPALILQQGLIAAGQRELDLLYGFPNPKATAVFKRIGYAHLADMVRYVRVIRYADYLHRHMPALPARLLGPAIDFALRVRDALRRMRGRRILSEWSERADPRMDELWQRSAHGDGLVAVRDAERARWRFDAAPFGRFRHLLLSEDGGATLSAWFSTEVEGRTLHVRDFWAVDAADGIGIRYIDALLRAARKAGLAAVSVELAARAPRLAGWMARRFVERGRHPVFGRWSDPQAAAGRDLDPFLTAADEDE